MLLGMYLMARFTRTWRALLKVVTTLLLATRDSFAMTMSVIACAAFTAFHAMTAIPHLPSCKVPCGPRLLCRTSSLTLAVLMHGSQTLLLMVTGVPLSVRNTV